MFTVVLSDESGPFLTEPFPVVTHAVLGGLQWLRVYPGATFDVVTDAGSAIVRNVHRCDVHRVTHCNVLRGSEADTPEVLDDLHDLLAGDE